MGMVESEIGNDNYQWHTSSRFHILASAASNSERLVGSCQWEAINRIEQLISQLKQS